MASPDRVTYRCPRDVDFGLDVAAAPPVHGVEGAPKNRTAPVVKSNGTFRNPEEWGFEERNLLHVAKWKFGNVTGETMAPPAFPSPAESKKLVPRVATNRDLLLERGEQTVERADGRGSCTVTAENLRRGSILTTWIGHSTFLVQTGGVNILTDPVWAERASPVQFAGPKRLVPVPLPLEQLPRISVVTISHNHYDHLDTAAVLSLAKHFNPIFVVPTGMRKWFQSHGSRHIDLSRVVELQWWESVHLVGTERLEVCSASGAFNVCVSSVPAKHWSMRSGFDRYCELWCGFVIDVLTSDLGRRRIYHGGDTGYCSVFKEIGEAYPGIDLALIPIGAYEPRWVMEPQHVNPEEAVQIYEDIRAKFSIGMHWGTFILTDEPIDDPPKRLNAIMATKRQSKTNAESATGKHSQSSGERGAGFKDAFRTLAVGESVIYTPEMLECPR